MLALRYLEAGEVSDAFNLGNGSGFSVREVVETARDVTGREIPTTISPRREGDPATLVSCPDKAREVLGWSPRYDGLKVIMESAWRWHQAEARRGY